MRRKRDVVTVKYGKRLMRAFEQPGGKALHKWLNRVENAEFSALTFRNGSAWRDAMLRDAPSFGEHARAFEELVGRYSDDELHSLMTDLGGHCFETLLEAFDHASQSDRRTMFIMYTIKGHGLPLAGHRDNHGLFLAAPQVRSTLCCAHSTRTPSPRAAHSHCGHEVPRSRAAALIGHARVRTACR